MPKTSWFTFIGEVNPKDAIPATQAAFQLERATGSVNIAIDGHGVTVDFITGYESFEQLFEDTFEFTQAFLSVATIHTGLPIQLTIHEWIERPLEPLGADGVSHPVMGRVYHESPDKARVSSSSFMFAVAEGIRWSKDIEANPFLRRAVLDFNYALQHPINDVPIYLYRAVESVQVYFGGESNLISSLDVSPQLKSVKNLANNALKGIHTRHAAKTVEVRRLTLDEIMAVVTATRDILLKFQMYALSQRIKNEE